MHYLIILAFASLPVITSNTVVFIEQDFPTPATNLTRIQESVSSYGGTHFHSLSLKAWSSPFTPQTTSDLLPPPDNATAHFLRAMAASSPSPLKVYAGIDVCEGPTYSCMLNYTLSGFAGQELARAVEREGLDGVQIYVSPYCNNPHCDRTTGKYATGIAAIIASFKAAAPTKDIILLANEWDHYEIIIKGGPTAVFSYQTVFYFTSLATCKAGAKELCGAGESVSYIQRAGKNFTGILEYLVNDKVAFLGQLKGASTPEVENPKDYWQGLKYYATSGGV